ncbi:hypothetical protein [Spirillospora sp. CA-294931]|uniref:hypothetical protein n=1 Tax=Spirillospora sp. CA-294931 TaxID=3240042 RepID=UPI003D8E5E4B
MITRTQLTCLIAGPLTMTAGRALLVPHDDEDYTGVLTEMTAAPARNAIGWFLAFLACALLIPASTTLAATFHDRFPRLSSATSVLLIIGWVSTSSTAPNMLLAADIADHAPLPSVVAGMDAYNDGIAGAFFLTSLLGIIGAITLAVGLYRSATVPKPAAALIGLGAVLTIGTMPGPLQALLIASSTVLLLGTTWSALALRHPPTA